MPAKKKDTHAVTLALHDARLSHIEPVLARIEERLDGIEASVHRNKGFWGAVTLIGSAIAAFLALFKDDLIRLLART